MRIAIACLLGSLLCFSAGFAADSSRDGYFLINGKVMVIRNDKVSEMTVEATLADGVRLLPDGTLVMKDGTKLKIAANQFMPMSSPAQHANADRTAQDVAYDRYGAAKSTEQAPVYYSAPPRYNNNDESHWINHSVRFGQSDDSRAYNDPR